MDANSMKTLYKTSLVNESQGFLKSINADALPHCTLNNAQHSTICNSNRGAVIFANSAGPMAYLSAEIP
jgi:hypothetical protein